jgi:hypothetical protein
MLDQNQQRGAAADQLDLFVLGENFARVFKRFWFKNIEASHVTPLLETGVMR